MDGAQQCFNLAGDYVPEFGVCDPNNVAGPCCSKGDVCLSSGLCKNAAGDIYQGGCTDKNYKSSACPSFCIDSSQFRITLCRIPLGANTTIADWDYCCDGEEKGRCCGNPKNFFHIDVKETSATRATATYNSKTIVIDSSKKSLASSRFSESTSKSIGSSSALSTTDATRASSILNSSPSRLNPQSSTSQSEAGPSSASTSLITEPKPSQAPSNVNSGTKIGVAVGASVGTIILLGLLYLWYRRTNYGRHPPRRRHGQGKRLSRATRGPISSPSCLVDPSSLPASFQRNPNAMAVGLGLAIEMNDMKNHPNGLAQPDDQQVSRNIPRPPPLSASFPTKAKTGPRYHSLPSSPSTVSQAHHHQDKAVLHRNLSSVHTPTSRFSPNAMNPTVPAPRIGNSRPSSFFRSPTFRRHPNPLRSNPPPTDLNDLLPLSD